MSSSARPRTLIMSAREEDNLFGDLLITAVERVLVI
jgi:hypothetical protein